MEFNVDEAGVRRLSIEMMTDLRNILRLASCLNDGSSVLQSALGDDYGTMNANMKQVMAELEGIGKDIDTVIKDMEAYIAMVKIIRVTVN